MNRFMRIVFFACCIILLTMCQSKPKTDMANIETKLENFDWLVGKWQRTNEEQGKLTYEYWDKVNNNEYRGIGFTMAKEDTLRQEKLTLIKPAEQWELVVKVPEEIRAITFEVEEYDDHSFKCINDSIDFPSVIKYWKEGNNLKALVSGDSLKIDFEFRKMK